MGTRTNSFHFCWPKCKMEFMKMKLIFPDISSENLVNWITTVHIFPFQYNDLNLLHNILAFYFLIIYMYTHTYMWLKNNLKNSAINVANLIVWKTCVYTFCVNKIEIYLHDKKVTNETQVALTRSLNAILHTQA